MNDYTIIGWLWLLNLVLLCWIMWKQRVYRKKQDSLSRLLTVPKGLGVSITCPRCRRTSYSRGDVFHGWCGSCQTQTSQGMQGYQQ